MSSDEEKERLQDIVSSAAKAAGKGNCPDEIWKKVGELKESKVNWKELLSALFSSQIISDYSYALPNKRSLWLTQFCQSKGFIGSGTSIILPTETVEGLVRADIYSDVSGSIPNSVKLKCLSEIVALTEAFGDFELTVQTWACSIFEKSRMKYDSSNSQEILNYSFIGTGGTDVYCVLDDAMNKESGEDNQDSFIIILTDGYFSQNKDSISVYEWGLEKVPEIAHIVDSIKTKTPSDCKDFTPTSKSLKISFLRPSFFLSDLQNTM
jgi:predicted metal-dependent peptidase